MAMIPQKQDMATRLDNTVRGKVASITRGMSPVSMATACVDWAMHLAMSPGKQMQLLTSGVGKLGRFGRYAAQSLVDKNAEPAAVVPAHDRRFNDEAWQQWPFNIMAQSFLLTREWISEATQDVDGVTADHQQLVSYLAHQGVDALSPFNFPLTNAQVLSRTRHEMGANLKRGMEHLISDIKGKMNDTPPTGTEAYEIGKDLACTPGKVVFRNRLIELIQYSPTTDTVVREPMLIVPPWIMKYYILDLSPRNSMVKYLVDQGHTVFMISWKNPDESDSDLELDDYVRLGVMDSLDVIGAIVPDTRINATGYCAGGTLLTIAAAHMAGKDDQRLNSVTTFTAQTDCTEPGDIKVFINDSQLTFIREMMSKKGYMDGPCFADSFAALNVNDLVWKPLIDRYLLGEETKLIDLMAWNKDLTRVPGKVHYRWVKEIFLENALAEDRYQVDGDPIHLSDLKLPLCFVATSTDHVAPWKSVFKINRLAYNAPVTFILTNGGHNAGIACGAEHPRRKHQMATRQPGDSYIRPDLWQKQTDTTPGSWWPSWDQWLKERSRGGTMPPSMGREGLYEPLADAPGSYVHIR